jgi:hypothetical protein
VHVRRGLRFRFEAPGITTGNFTRHFRWPLISEKPFYVEKKTMQTLSRAVNRRPTASLQRYWMQNQFRVNSVSFSFTSGTRAVSRINTCQQDAEAGDGRKQIKRIGSEPAASDEVHLTLQAFTGATRSIERSPAASDGTEPAFLNQPTESAAVRRRDPLRPDLRPPNGESREHPKLLLTVRFSVIQVAGESLS